MLNVLKKENKKIDVLYLGRHSEENTLSGPEKTAVRIFTEHTKIFKSCFIQYFFDGNKYGLWKKIFGRETIITAGSSEIITLGLVKIIAELFKRKPGIIHIITFERFAFLGLMCRLLFSTKIIYSVHGIIAYENDELKKINWFLKLKDKICERLFFKYSDTLIFYSENSIDIAEKYFKIDESKAVILSGGIDAVFRDKNKSVSKSGNLKIIFHNDNVLRKSAADFLKKSLSKLDYTVELNVTGTEDKPFSEINPKVQVKYYSRLDTQELAKLYEENDIFLSLSKYDTFSISSIEAMASGLVPIVTRETGMSRYIEDGVNGFTIKYGDIETLLHILKKLNSERAEINNISRSAKEICEILSWHNVYDTYRNIYISLTK